MENNNIFIAKTDEDDKVVWSTKKIEMLMDAIEQGIHVKHAPFHEGNPQLRKANINFEYTAEELEELVKCSRDIVYFANKYCTVMTDEGIRQIALRDYQEDMLRHFVSNRFSIVLASRQIGKCLDARTMVNTNKHGYISIIDLYSIVNDKKTTIFRVKYFLYKILKRLSTSK